MTAVKALRSIGACPDALAWAAAHGGTLAELWQDCHRVDWLLWYADKAGASLEGLVRAAAGCAELTLPYAGSARATCEATIAAARAWADAPGVGTAANAARAADAARAVAAAARAANAANAAYAAAYAADAARAARAAAYAAYAARAAAVAAAVDAAGASAEMHAACADVVRVCVPFVEAGK